MSATAEHGETEGLAVARAEARKRAEADDLTGARALLEEAVAVGEFRLGRDHPRLVPLIVDLASIASEVGNLTEAQTQLTRAYGIVVASSEPDHPFALSIEDRLASITYRLGEPTESYDIHLAEVGARVLGAGHAVVRRAGERLQTPNSPPDPLPAPPGPPAVPPFVTSEPLPKRTPGPAEPAEPAAWPPGNLAPADLSAGNPAASPYAAPVFSPPPAFDSDIAYEFAAHGMNEPGYAPTYTPSPHAPGVYDRQTDDPANNSATNTDDGIYVVAPPGRVYRAVDVWRESPRDPPQAGPQAQRRSNTQGNSNKQGTFSKRGNRPPTRTRAGGALATSLVVAVLVAGAIVGYQLIKPSGQHVASDGQGSSAAPNSTPGAPTVPAQAPPTQVTLRDGGGSVTLTWLDPSGGRTPFIVAGGRAGTPSQPFETVPAGRMTSTIYGLNKHYDYCFTVTAIYSTAVTAPSSRVCTHRLSTSSASQVS